MFFAHTHTCQWYTTTVNTFVASKKYGQKKPENVLTIVFNYLMKKPTVTTFQRVLSYLTNPELAGKRVYIFDNYRAIPYFPSILLKMYAPILSTVQYPQALAVILDCRFRGNTPSLEDQSFWIYSKILSYIVCDPIKATQTAVMNGNVRALKYLKTFCTPQNVQGKIPLNCDCTVKYLSHLIRPELADRVVKYQRIYSPTLLAKCSSNVADWLAKHGTDQEFELIKHKCTYQGANLMFWDRNYLGMSRLHHLWTQEVMNEAKKFLTHIGYDKAIEDFSEEMYWSVMTGTPNPPEDIRLFLFDLYETIGYDRTAELDDYSEEYAHETQYDSYAYAHNLSGYTEDCYDDKYADY
jgi:hypothetical protein